MSYFSAFNTIPQTQITLPTKSLSCPHLECQVVHGITFCIQCGMEIHSDALFKTDVRYQSYNLENKPSESADTSTSIVKDLQQYHFQEPIIDIANKLYVEITQGQVFRGKPRNSFMFACVYYSYKYLQITELDYNSLMKLFNITKKRASKGILFLHTRISKTSPFLHHTSTMLWNWIETILASLHATSEHREDVYFICEHVSQSNIMNKAKHKSIAASIVYYWIESHKDLYPIQMKEFKSFIPLNMNTIKKITKEIKQVMDETKTLNQE